MKFLGKTIAVGLSKAVGTVASVAQTADYLQSLEFNIFILGVFIVAAAVVLLFSPELVSKFQKLRSREDASVRRHRAVEYVAPGVPRGHRRRQRGHRRHRGDGIRSRRRGPQSTVDPHRSSRGCA
ncbi:hypothetical protein [Amycolatopsis balhimycina]|uniref:hypothetical protein n=1 Tax=Amycolatopsis balhimycina TaxID=208443 RepID=UPI000F7A055E|nr:hypothetical protein [Amycolatopsis balhimycina]